MSLTGKVEKVVTLFPVPLCHHDNLQLHNGKSNATVVVNLSAPKFLLKLLELGIQRLFQL